MKIAFVPGRFQPPHKGHISLVDLAKSDDNEIIYFTIVDGQTSARNPLSVDLRKRIIDGSDIDADVMVIKPAAVHKMIVNALQDPRTQNDTEFHFTLYCGSDRMKQYQYQMIEKYYEMAKTDTNRLDVQITGEVKEIPRDLIPISATEIRQAITDNNIEEAKRWLTFDNDILYREVEQAIMAGLVEQVKEKTNLILEKINANHSIQIG